MSGIQGGMFLRGLSDKALACLQDRISKQPDGWCSDLLALWAPTGTPSTIDGSAGGLRLCVHAGQLDFYRYGNCIAKVTFASDGEPQASVARPYVDGAKGLLRWAVGSSTTNEGFVYDGVATLRVWMQRSEEHELSKRKRPSRGWEKYEVDQIASVNRGVLELEMSLPRQPGANSESKGAPRIDLVAVEPAGAGFQLVFWEVKVHGDSRLVSNDDEVEVLGQLDRFNEWLSRNEDLVLQAYRKVWDQLKRLSDWANFVKARRGLPLITGCPWQQSSSSVLIGVDHVPRLVVVTPKGGKPNRNWASIHRDKLTKYQLLEFSDHESPVLCHPGQQRGMPR